MKQSTLSLCHLSSGHVQIAFTVAAKAALLRLAIGAAVQQQLHLLEQQSKVNCSRSLEPRVKK